MNVIMMVNYSHRCTEKLFVVNSWIVRLRYIQPNKAVKEDSGRRRGKENEAKKNQKVEHLDDE
jgi:hypothetical protein